jgi:uncharacterized protein involved in exopolysaccharide biosynthesis/Mrp family chromosome partitioning ATPase
MTQSGMSLRDIYYVIFRHKQKVIGFFITVVLLAGVITMLMPKVYQSTAQLLLRLGRENTTLDPAASMGAATVNVNGESRETEINSEIEVLKSRELAEKIVDSIGITRLLGNVSIPTPLSAYDSLKIREKAVQRVSKNLAIELVKKTNIISVAFLAHDPRVAHDVVDALIRFYEEKHMAIYRPSSSYKFIEQQQDALSDEMKATEDSLNRLKNSSGIVSVPEQQTSILTRLASLQDDYEKVKVELAASQAKVEDLQKTMENIPSIMAQHKMGGVPLSSNEVLRTKINELRVQQLDMLTKYNDNSRRVKDLKQQISQASAMLDTEDLNNNSSGAMRQMQADLLSEQSNLAAYTARESNLRTLIAQARGEMENFNNTSATVARLQRQLEIDQDNYRKYSEHLNQAKIDSGLKNEKLSNISIIQEATLPLKSTITTRRIYSILFGLFFGLFGGLAIAFIFELLDHTVKRFDDVENYLGLPALGVIPVLAGSTTIPWKIPRSCSQTFDTLRETLRRARKDQAASKVLAVMSCYDGEGTDLIAPFLAVNQIPPNGGGRVLLADLDMAKPTLHATFSIPQTPGVSDFNKSDAGASITPTSFTTVSGLDILSAGREFDGAIQLGKSNHFADSMGAWKKKYDYIVFKMPPFSRSSLIMEIADYIDDVIMVVESERVRREVIVQSTSKLSRAGINVFGVILNNYRYYLPQWLYKRL